MSFFAHETIFTILTCSMERRKGRPRKYTTPQEAKEAHREAMKRYQRKMTRKIVLINLAEKLSSLSPEDKEFVLNHANAPPKS